MHKDVIAQKIKERKNIESIYYFILPYNGRKTNFNRNKDKEVQKDITVEKAQIALSLQACKEDLMLKEDRKAAAGDQIKVQKGGKHMRNTKINNKQKKNYYIVLQELDNEEKEEVEAQIDNTLLERDSGETSLDSSSSKESKSAISSSYESKDVEEDTEDEMQIDVALFKEEQCKKQKEKLIAVANKISIENNIIKEKLKKQREDNQRRRRCKNHIDETARIETG